MMTKIAEKLPKRPKKAPSEKQKKEKVQYYAQDYIGIDEIIGNTVFLKNGSAVGIMEVIPINYFQMHAAEQNMVTMNFQNMFRIAPVKLHFKIRSERADTSTLIRNIRNEMKDETNPKVLAQLEDYIQHIHSLQRGQSISQRFYVIYEYEGDGEHMSTSKEEIVNTMLDTRQDLANQLRQIGNIVPEYPVKDLEKRTRNMLYKFYNPISSETESLEERIERIDSDVQKYNDSVPEEYHREATDNDYVAPRGLDMTHTGYVVMDGQYHTYIAIRNIGFPSISYGSWISNIAKAPGIDYDIFTSKLDHTRTLTALKQANRWNRVTVNQQSRKGNIEKAENVAMSVNNIKGITDAMELQDEDLYDVMVMITIRASSYKVMMRLRNGIAKALEAHSIYTFNSFLQASRFFKMSQPLMEIDFNLFTMCKRNFLTSSLPSLYSFTAYELYDDEGFVMGTLSKSDDDFGSIVSFNNFNTSMYANGNILIIGTSGSGKTFTEEMLAYRMRLTGVRTIFILPTKGKTDYYNGCQNIGGEFITLAPSSENHVNIMAIRPAAVLDNEMEDAEDEGNRKLSLLSSKINSVIVFISLLMGDEKMSLSENALLGRYLTDLYSQFGITDDNNSIWMDESHTELKYMPVLGDLLAIIDGDPKLERISILLDLVVHGDYKSLNEQTNVDLSNRYIVFDVDDALVNERMLPAFLYVAFDCAYSMAKENLYRKDAIFLDEVWKIMANEASAKQVKDMIKLIRAYGACTVMATQDIEDFLGKTGDFGSSVITNTENKIFMRLNEKEVQMVSDIIDFTPQEKKTLTTLRHRGMIFSGGNKVICHFKPIEIEEEVFTTDINRRREIAEKRKLKKEAQQKRVISP